MSTTFFALPNDTHKSALVCLPCLRKHYRRTPVYLMDSGEWWFCEHCGKRSDGSYSPEENRTLTRQENKA